MTHFPNKPLIFNSSFSGEPIFKSSLEKTSTLKSRHLSAAQLFDILQEEYIVCELRSKIYPECLKNKEGKIVYPRDYWKSLMQKKKDKIIDLATKNNLFSIFDDSRVMNDFYKKIIPENGFPKFIYKDDHQRLLQEKWDIHNYYSKGSLVKVLLENGECINSAIEKVDFSKDKAYISLNQNSLLEVPLESITRIF